MFWLGPEGFTAATNIASVRVREAVSWLIPTRWLLVRSAGVDTRRPAGSLLAAARIPMTARVHDRAGAAGTAFGRHLPLSYQHRDRAEGWLVLMCSYLRRLFSARASGKLSRPSGQIRSDRSDPRI